jgi:hypothetical protein
MMKKLIFAALAATALSSTAPLQAQEVGPTPYLSQADSPFASMSFTYFYLEDVEDGLINTPGLTVTGPGVCIAGTNCFVGSGLIDSVGNGGNGNVGNSIFANGSLTLTFDAAILGALPTAAGLVWTDGANPITFEAFDQNGVSLGVIIGNNADGSITGETAEDRFFGAINTGGISMLTISDTAGIEIDQVQYGLLSQIAGVPEPSSWAMMVIGFGAIGFSLRRNKRRIAQLQRA